MIIYSLLSTSDDKWKELATQNFGETEDNYQDKIQEFYLHLSAMQNKKDNHNNSKLLQKIPSCNIAHSKSIYEKPIYDDIGSKDIKDEELECAIGVRRFLLKFLRGGNHDVERSTKLLIDYVQSLKDHPKYYKGLTNQGNPNVQF